MGEPVALATLEALADRACIERLESRALVDVAMEGSTRQVRMGHPLYGEVLRAELPGSRYERICRELSEAVERAGELSAEDALRVAVWRLESGDTEHAELLTAAAQQAAFAFDFRLARRLARGMGRGRRRRRRPSARRDARHARRARGGRGRPARRRDGGAQSGGEDADRRGSCRQPVSRARAGHRGRGGHACRRERGRGPEPASRARRTARHPCPVRSGHDGGARARGAPARRDAVSGRASS